MRTLDLSNSGPLTTPEQTSKRWLATSLMGQKRSNKSGAVFARLTVNSRNQMVEPRSCGWAIAEVARLVFMQIAVLHGLEFD